MDDSSSAGPGRYGALLQQVQQVTMELQEARVLIASFQRENEELVSNFDACSRELMSVKAAFEEARQDATTAAEREIDLIERHESFREQVRLADRARSTGAGGFACQRHLS